MKGTAFDRLIYNEEDEYIQDSKVTINYKYFYDRIVQQQELTLDDLYKAIDSLEIIDIELEPQHGDNPQLIFESLNSTGLDLTEADKIRNFVLMNLAPNIQEQFYDKYWNKIEKCSGNDKIEFIDNQRAYGNFFTLLDAGMAFFFKQLSLSGKIVGFTREEKLEVPAEALREALTNALCHRMFHSTSSSVGIAIYDNRVEIENTGHLPDELTVETIKQSHHSYPQNPTIADVLFKTTFLENWGSGVSRMVDACKNAHLPEPEFNQNAAFVWVTFKRATIQPYNPTTHNPTSSPLNPTTSKDNNRTQKLKSFFSIIGENGANLKMLMEGMHLRDRKSFVNNYINPNLSEGYIAMLYPEVPNHPMQSYYLTKKGRELLEQL